MVNPLAVPVTSPEGHALPAPMGAQWESGPSHLCSGTHMVQRPQGLSGLHLDSQVRPRAPQSCLSAFPRPCGHLVCARTPK